MTIDKKGLFITGVICIVIAVAFGLPKVKYQSTDLLKEVSVPMQVGAWKGKDVDTGIKLMDKNYNFINAIFLREYKHPSGRIVYLYLLDAGNFHNPKVCMTGAGYKTEDLPDTHYATAAGPGFDAPSVVFSKPGEKMVISYWIVINGKRVGWLEQKAMEMWCSLVGVRKSGLMVRTDTPMGSYGSASAVEATRDFVSLLNGSLGEKDRVYLFGRQ